MSEDFIKQGSESIVVKSGSEYLRSYSRIYRK